MCSFWATLRGGSKHFGKGTVRGRSPEPSAEENFEKLDVISCNLAYIFGIRMASDIIQNWAFAEQKNSSGHDFETHRY